MVVTVTAIMMMIVVVVVVAVVMVVAVVVIKMMTHITGRVSSKSSPWKILLQIQYRGRV